MRQYHIWYEGVILESTGYISSLQKAKNFARGRYGNDVLIEIAYPPSACDGVKHKVTP